MDPLRAVFLGLLQGLTEFLPISSSGHLVLVEQLFGELSNPQTGLFFNVMLHLGTLLAVVIFCWTEVMMMFRALLRLGRRAETPEQRADRRLLIVVILATLPTAVVGMAIKLTGLGLFTWLIFVGAMFIITAAVLWFSRFIGGEKREPSFVSALFIGAIQGLGVLPGISRSGVSIVAGKASGMSGPSAARFAFVISIPAILGAAILSSFEMANLPNFNTGLIFSLLCGIITAALAGYLSLGWLTKIVRRARLEMFAFYCAAIGIVTLIVGAVR